MIQNKYTIEFYRVIVVNMITKLAFVTIILYVPFAAYHSYAAGFYQLNIYTRPNERFF